LHRPNISHPPGKIDNRTRTERQADKQTGAAERRATKNQCAGSALFLSEH